MPLVFWVKWVGPVCPQGCCCPVILHEAPSKEPAPLAAPWQTLQHMQCKWTEANGQWLTQG